MSGEAIEAGADDGAVQAAYREYQHQRDCILQYLADCREATEDKNAGAPLTGQDHFGSVFDTLTIVDATRAFLDASDARIQAGSNAEKVALAELLTQYRRILPLSPLTTTLAEVAGRAVKAKGTYQGQNGAEKNKATAREEAQKVRDISDKARRHPDGTLANPGVIGRQMAKKLGKEVLDPKTVKKYDSLNRLSGRVDGFPAGERE